MASSVADAIVALLKSSGVRRLYGVPGDSLNGFTDALRRDGGITWEHVRHEEAAGFAAGQEAGVVGTACLDTVNYLKYRRTGGKDSPLAWEFPPVDSWDQAPDPGQVGKRLLEGFTQRELPDSWAGPVSTVMHWSYGSGWGALYGVLAGSLRRLNPLYGLPLGAVVWVSGYVLLPEGGLYKPIWEYDAKTLAEDLSAHLGYGAGTGTTFWLITKIWR